MRKTEKTTNTGSGTLFLPLTAAKLWEPQIELPPLISWKIQETCTEKKGWGGEMANEEGKYGYRWLTIGPKGNHHFSFSLKNLLKNCKEEHLKW